MQSCVDVFQPYYFGGILGSSKDSKYERIDEFLLTDQYTIVNGASSQIEIYDQKGIFIDCLKQEILRFSNAASESISNSQVPRKSYKSIAWQFIEMYYAGYFSAQALLRISGKSNSRLDQRIINLLNIKLTKQGLNSWVAIKGSYEINYNDSSKMILLTKLDEAGGAHALLWKQFNIFINEILSDPKIITLPSDDITCLIQIVNTLQNGIHANQGHWLSEIRNKVNYRMEYDVWHPYGSNRSYYISFKDYLLKVKEPPHSGPDEIYNAMWAILAICQILVGNLENIKMRSKRSSILQKILL